MANAFLSLLRRGIGGFQEPQESAAVFRSLMQMAAKDIAEGGEIKAARKLRKDPEWWRVVRMRRQG